MYLFIEYPKCSTCKKAKKWLDDNKIVYEERNIVTKTPTKIELKNWINMSGFNIDKLFNTSGILYKNMNLKEKLKNLSENEKLNLLSSNGMLIKRPLIVGKNVIVNGFKENEWIDKIKS